ncbi:MAG: sigma-54-dependent Fis family transcriptional regulator [Desulfuromonadales bacterium]|nr:sigma-54-dependent Fis family transcriptional regulator [Desulfuromonadales bacterium]
MRVAQTIKNFESQIVASNAKTKFAVDLVEKMAQINNPIIIHGANGTGKGLFARSIQQQSSRNTLPFVYLPASVLTRDKTEQQIQTYLDEVGSGTLLLEEVHELDIEIQQILQKKLAEPLTRQKIRIITTTSTDLEAQTQAGNFSPALLATLQGGYIELLPLRDRKEDIGALTTFYVEQICRANGTPTKNISPELLHILEAYNWPGNVRELVNTVEQLLITAQEKKTLFTKDLPAHIRIQTLKSSSAQKKGL